MLSVPPSGQSPVIRRGASGWPAYSLQGHLRYVGLQLKADGYFGVDTQIAVETFQADRSLTVDGVAGPATQATLVSKALQRVEASAKTPVGLLKGQLLSEGGLMVAPVNWSVPGGVDCGPAQWRVFGPPFPEMPSTGISLRDAFSPIAIVMSANTLLERIASFMQQPWVGGSRERAGRLAAFAHNWPSQGGADYYAIHGHVSNPDAPCSWLPRDSGGDLVCRFPDGALVRTRQDWAEFYAMGGVHGDGAVTRFVRSWT